MVEDVYTLCKSPMERKRANSVMIPVLIRLGKFEEALKILDENTPEEIYNTSKIIGGFIKSQLSNTSKLNVSTLLKLCFSYRIPCNFLFEGKTTSL